MRRIQDLKSFTLHAKDGDVGRLREVYFDDSSWKIRYLVVETGHWLVGRQVLITPEALGAIHEEKWTLQVELTREQIEASPPLSVKQPLSRQQEEEYHRHYSWLPYWRSSLLGYLGWDSENQREKAEDPHLRSSAEVTGYRIEARDGEVGYVEDFVIDEKDWVVRYLEISTHRGWFGKKILLAPTWIEQVDWEDRKVRVELLREVIRSAPEYEEGQLIGRDYEISLYSHYGRNQYWE
ncbi:PRC-barrel domain-containing protein [Nitrosococcus watsonii]|nr:PRC-barrel domain-containing protein [Nitrosococcus watsonii]